jgi:hypothetical protein
MFAAKVDRLPATLGAASGRFIHGHAAYEVDCHDVSPFHLPPLRMRTKKTLPLARHRMTIPRRSFYPARSERAVVITDSRPGAPMSHPYSAITQNDTTPHFESRTWCCYPINRSHDWNLLGNRLARLLALAAFDSTCLAVGIIRKRFARLGTMVAALRTALGHHGGKRPATRTDLGTGGTAGRTVPAVHQARQVFLLAIGQQVCTVRGTEVARTLAVRTRFGTILQLLIDLHFSRLGLLGERIYSDDSQCERQRHHTESTKHTILHGKRPFQRGCHLASDRNCRSTQVTETKKADVNNLLRVSVHIGLFCNEPPGVTGLLFVESSNQYCIRSNRERIPLEGIMEYRKRG